jgi:hypothetical protein
VTNPSFLWSGTSCFRTAPVTVVMGLPRKLVPSSVQKGMPVASRTGSAIDRKASMFAVRSEKTPGDRSPSVAARGKPSPKAQSASSVPRFGLSNVKTALARAASWACHRYEVHAALRMADEHELGSL